jgi:Fe-S-cluster containining protein
MLLESIRKGTSSHCRPVLIQGLRGAVYKNPEQYFEACNNCGECCRIPGIFLPREVDPLGSYLRLDRRELFRRYLIAELFTPNVTSPPVFVISPVKTRSSSKRCDHFLSDHAYARDLQQQCIFRDPRARACTIHSVKPFSCSMLICRKMTKAGPLLLNKTYYYHQWAPSQDILFSIFPELEEVYRRLLAAVMELSSDNAERIEALMRGNEIIRVEITGILNGRAGTSKPFYRTHR